METVKIKRKKKGRGKKEEEEEGGGGEKRKRTFSPGSRLESLANQRRRETRLIFGD